MGSVPGEKIESLENSTGITEGCKC